MVFSKTSLPEPYTFSTFSRWGTGQLCLDPFKKARERRSETPGNPLDVDEGNVPHSPLCPTVVRSMQATSLRSLFLIDSLLFAYAADSATEAYADVERHRPPSSSRAADAYTADESHSDLTADQRFLQRCIAILPY
jgi:hypothetical protein